MPHRSFFSPKNTCCLTFLFTLILLFISDLAIADNSEAFFELSTSTNQSGMFVLAAWAIANIVIGIFGWKRKDGAEMYFHQMNFFWNIVNLAIAGYALFQFTASDPSAYNFTEALGQHLKTKNLFIINAGLDIIYIIIGLYLLKHAGKPIKKTERLKGFGRSIILQGGFLFVFDLIMYALQMVNESKFPEMF
jgi:hypothetical protein